MLNFAQGKIVERLALKEGWKGESERERETERERERESEKKREMTAGGGAEILQCLWFL